MFAIGIRGQPPQGIGKMYRNSCKRQPSQMNMQLPPCVLPQACLVQTLAQKGSSRYFLEFFLQNYEIFFMNFYNPFFIKLICKVKQRKIGYYRIFHKQK
jgi:hypothetical protein